MLKELALKFNAVDLLALLIFVRCIWMGRNKGVRVEAFNLLGIVLASFIVFHYYGRFSAVFVNVLGFPPVLAEILAYIVLWLSTIIVMAVCCDSWQLMYKPEEKNVQHRSLFAGFMGAARAAVVTSLALVLLLVTGNGYLREEVSRSFSARIFGQVSILIYEGIYTAVSIPFPSEQRNNAVILIYQQTPDGGTSGDNSGEKSDTIDTPEAQ